MLGEPPDRYVRRSRGRPSWRWLYAIVLALGIALVPVEVFVPNGGERRAAEGAAGVSAIAAMAFWVRGNRVALDLMDHPRDD